MSKPESRSRLRRALRSSWRALKLTLVPAASGAAPLDEAPIAPGPMPVARTEGSMDEPAPPPEGSTASVETDRLVSSVSTVAVSPPTTQASPAPSSASAEILALVQARLDLFSERLELLREQVATTTALASASAVAARPDSAPRPPRPGSVQREIGRLSERLERLERRNAPDELPSRAALRPPRVPTGLDVFESAGTPATASTEWDFPDGAVMGPRLMGTFQDLRLATLLEVLQLERRVGVLILRAAEHTLELDVRRGSVTGARRDGSDTEVVAAIREAFRWPSAEFTFRRTETVRESGAPRSIHGLMLEVVRQNDEAARAG